MCRHGRLLWECDGDYALDPVTLVTAVVVSDFDCNFTLERRGGAQSPSQLNQLNLYSNQLTSCDTFTALPSSSGPCTSRPPSAPPSLVTRCSSFPSLYINAAECYHQMNQNPSYSSQERTPAMLAAFQNQKANLFAPQSSINPSHLLQQQHNGMGISSGGSINPAALTAASPSSSSSFPQQQQQHFNSMLQVVGMTREQFQNLSPQDRHTVGEKYRSVFNAHQQQQQQQQMAMINAGLVNNNNAFSNQAQNQNFYDRPSSSASSHSQQPSSSSRQPSSSTSHQMMPPPPPRPPTAQGGHSSRPSTSQARSPTIPGSQQGQMLDMMQQGQQRSQSRMVCFYYTILIPYSYSPSSKGPSR
jgi:hypothetical protein